MKMIDSANTTTNPAPNLCDITNNVPIQQMPFYLILQIHQNPTINLFGIATSVECQICLTLLIETLNSTPHLFEVEHYKNSQKFNTPFV